MAVVKKFKLDVIESPSNQTVVADLGFVKYAILGYIKDMPLFYYDPIGAGTTPWNGYVDNPNLVGGANTAANIPTFAMTSFAAAAPNIQIRDLTNPAYSGKYLRLKDQTNGFYAISTGSIDTANDILNDSAKFNFYDSNGSLVVMFSPNDMALPIIATNNNKRLNFVASFKEDGVTIKNVTEGGVRYTTELVYQNLNSIGYKLTNLAGGPSQQNWDKFIGWLNGVPNLDIDEPYPGIDPSEPSGPAEGDGIPPTDAIDIPTLPTVSVLDTGFVTLFNPTLSQVKDLADYMWAGLFDVNTFKKLFADPMDCILGFNMVPVNITTGAYGNVTVGNVPTGVQMFTAASQWVELDCGSITLNLPYGCYLDFAPYSKASIYLPYIGTVELSIDDIMGRTLHLVYHVDILSCSCVAYLKCGPDTLYQFTGSCGYSIPLTGDSFGQMIANIVSMAGTLAGAMASGGITAPAAVAASVSHAQDVMNSKPEIHRSGSIGSSAGIMGIQKAFLILELPKACKPEKQYHYTGYPGFITVKVGDLSGYAEFETIILNGIACTSEERQLIEEMCKGGIYV